ncbi:MAG: restriction endonuclease subunit S [Cyclobacteriaceae bacterium]
MREDWTEALLPQVCDILDNLRKPINAKERTKRIEGKPKNELYPYYGATGQVGYIDDYLTDGEYVLIGEDAAPFLDYTKAVAFIINGKTWVNNHAHILKSHFNDKYLCYYLNQFQFREYVTGTTRLKLTQGAMKRMPVKIAPLPEQRAIVAKIEQLLSELDNGIANLKAAQEKLAIYRQAVLKKAFEGELTKQWRSQQTHLPTADELLEQIQAERKAHYQQQLKAWQQSVIEWDAQGRKGKKPAKPKKAKEVEPLDEAELDILPTIASSWKWDTLMNIAELIGGVTKGRKLEGKELISLPYLRVANVQDGYLDLSQIKEIEVLPSDLEKYKLHKGDILYTEGGDKDKLGRGTIWNDEIKDCIHQNHIFRARLYRKDMSPKFVGYYSQTRTAKDYFFSKAKQTTNLASINLTVLSNLPFPICSLNEQTQIVQEIESRLSVCDKLATTIDESLEKSEALRQSILKKAFRGKLLSEAELEACRQEPDWEPADKLLRRIQGKNAVPTTGNLFET